jgi:hypothetical protein
VKAFGVSYLIGGTVLKLLLPKDEDSHRSRSPGLDGSHEVKQHVMYQRSLVSMRWLKTQDTPNSGKFFAPFSGKKNSIKLLRFL